ncbi:MAG: hypothetical protein LKM32_10185 [Chiayiivirga sp.]|jgi:hypothetical protein|uniref:hypothetical protein n=1 Tax=Chiayiivirga sp. TaxID=2041042 RepID=UPI0025C69A90|nr:hypothetical protein [Chiayiivirga sp.]MCI1729719.1 hypothetical protein [Chiayiivirga sp.]
MNLTLATDVFRRRGTARPRIEREFVLGADAYVVPEPAFVTGLRDWRRTPATSPRQSAHAADGDWHPL